MTDAEELVRRFLALWQEYLTALLADPAAAALLQAGILSSLHGRRSPAEDGEDEASGSPPFGSPPFGSTSGAAPAAGPSGERDQLVAELARRLARLEERMAAVERKRRAPARARGRSRNPRP